jgi:hypothetical protein
MANCVQKGVVEVREEIGYDDPYRYRETKKS